MDFTKARGLFTSCATPAASCPTIISRSMSARSLSAWRRNRSLSASRSRAWSRSSCANCSAWRSFR
ncbi:hypothetical protein ACN28S_14435 [Cystobacter fuscus]